MILDDAAAMEIAFAEARVAQSLGEVPIGCCVVSAQGELLARAGNRVETWKDATAHAEVLALRQAMGSSENWRLEGCKLYVTLEPCPMCAGAILNSRVATVHFAAPDLRLGACGSICDLLGDNPIHRVIQVHKGQRGEESVALLQNFFKALRRRNKEKGRKSR